MHLHVSEDNGILVDWLPSSLDIQIFPGFPAGVVKSYFSLYENALNNIFLDWLSLRLDWLSQG